MSCNFHQLTVRFYHQVSHQKYVSYFDELLGGGEAAHAEGQQDPAAGVAAFGRVLAELLADLTIDLVSEAEDNIQQTDQRPSSIHETVTTAKSN